MPLIMGILAQAAAAPTPPAVASDYDLLETEILTGTQASVTFSSLNSTYGSTYQHLQLRYIFRDSRSNAFGAAFITLNGDSAANYRDHNLRGDGSAVTSDSYSRSGIPIEGTGNTAAANAFAGGIIDFADAFSSNKNTVTRNLHGRVVSGDNFIAFSSCLWNNTAALTSMTITPSGGNDLLTGSRFSLYGLKAA